jgi:hypothetical protein
MKRRLPLIFVAVVTVLCLVAASVAAVAAGVGGSPVAYRVNGTKVSQSTVDHQLKALADPDTATKVQKVFGQAPTTSHGAVSSAFTATWLDLQIRNQLLHQGAEKAGTTLSDRDREAQRPVLDKLLADNNIGFTVAALPLPLQRALLENYAYPVALGLDTQAKVTAFFTAAVRKADIAIDPRYGFWSPRNGVCPPTGCTSSAAGG